jgi:CRISPR-associated protein Cas5 subtype I-C
MCGSHRSKTIQKIRKHLEEGRACRVITTSLIEAGVDIDFPRGFQGNVGNRLDRSGCRSLQQRRAAAGEGDRQQRASTILIDVEYFIEAHLVGRTADGQNHGKHADIFRRHCDGGKCHHQPYFGCREFPAHFDLWSGPLPRSPLSGERDLGFMLYDIDFADNMEPMFFRAVMRDGIVDVPAPESEEVRR